MKFKLGLLFCLLLSVYEETYAQSLKKIVIDEKDFYSGYYLVVEPPNHEKIEGVLVLLAGFGQRAEDTPPETKLQNMAYANNVLTVFFAGGNKLYADSITQVRLTKMLNDVLKRYKTKSNSFVIGGFSAGGMIAMRYVELCMQYPNTFPIQPRGVFTADSPLDIFTIYEQLEENIKNNYSDLAVEEAQRAIKHINADYGIPRANNSTYANLSPVCMNKAYGQNEIYLKDVAVRTYHDVDIAWRIINRNQTVHGSNYEVSAELINRLVLMGNTKAEFMQSFKTGYRANGNRHPHSWSIINEVEFMQWMMSLIKN
jgi:hypothetical protein